MGGDGGARNGVVDEENVEISLNDGLLPYSPSDDVNDNVEQGQ